MRKGAGYILMLALLLRLPRLVVRWEEWALHYAAYNLPTLEALLSGEYTEAGAMWVGLHPPLYPLLHSVMTALWPAPLLWMMFSVGASLAAVALLLHAEPKSLMPGFLLATDPVQLHYAAEVNNYPLGVLVLSYAWWAYRRDRPIHLAVAVGTACWTHVLAGCMALVLALLHAHRARILTSVGLLVVPLVATAWSVGLDSGSRTQPDLLFELSVADAIGRFGVGWVVLLPILLIGLVRVRDAAILWGTGVALWLGLVLLGFAAPHQFPYATFVGVPAAAVLAAAAGRGRGLMSLIVVVAMVRSGTALVDDAKRVGSIWGDLRTERGIDHVWSISLPGDAIVLVRGPGAPDDDKRQHSPTLWRLPPWLPMEPLFTTVRPDTVGQPRLLRGRRIYTFNHPIPAIGDIPGEHVFTVLYNGAEQNPSAIPDHSGQGDWTRAGPDLWRGPTGGDSAGDDASTGAATDGSPPGPQPAE